MAEIPDVSQTVQDNQRVANARIFVKIILVILCVKESNCLEKLWSLRLPPPPQHHRPGQLRGKAERRKRNITENITENTAVTMQSTATATDMDTTETRDITLSTVFTTIQGMEEEVATARRELGKEASTSWRAS